ncbi:MAG: sensor histidine kinase [Prevotella sp.]
MKTLVSKTLTRYVICMIVILLMAIPVFYWLTKQFYAEDMIDIVMSVQQGHGIPDLDLEEDVAQGVLLQFFLIIIVISVSMYITMRFVLDRVWLPFNDTLKKIEKFNLAKGKLPEFCQTDIKEFANLNAAITKMMEKDKEVFRIQKEFTENASHELQTPLAIIRSKLDLLMQEEMNEKQTQLVSDLYDLTDRMAHLNRNLLLLAKIDNVQYVRMEETDVCNMVKQMFTTYYASLFKTKVSVIDMRSSAGVRIMANAVLMESLLKNLIVNAIRHCMEKSEKEHVSGVMESEPSENDYEVEVIVYDDHIEVSNDGKGEKPLDADKLFRRFATAGIKSCGNGLGLAIVKAICKFHSWQVDYKYEDDKHKFIVYFLKT